MSNCGRIIESKRDRAVKQQVCGAKWSLIPRGRSKKILFYCNK